MKKSITSVAAVAIMSSLALTACGGSADGGATEGSDAGGEVTLQMVESLPAPAAPNY